MLNQLKVHWLMRLHPAYGARELRKNLYAFTHLISLVYRQVSVPVHLYGELVQTKDGITLLEQKGDFEDFLGLLCSDKATSLQKRGALWVLVNSELLRYLNLSNNICRLILGRQNLATKNYS